MKKILSKVLIVAMTVIMLFGVGPISQNVVSGSVQGITVTAQAATGKIHINKSKITLTTGETYTQKLIDKKGKTITATKVTWKSADKKIAKISKKGKITAVKKGKVKLTATYKGKKYSFTVTIKNASFKTSSKTLTKGKSFTQVLLNASGKKISPSKITWASANKSIATVSSKGKVTAKKAGKVKISATYMGKKYTFTVTVKAKTSSSTNTGDPDNDDSNGKTVYRTPSGSRYHLDPDCGGKNSYSVTIDKAKNAGLTPCKTCAS